jgi:MFS family permease
VKAKPFVFPAMLRALNSRNYRLFYSGQFISLVGTWMDTVAESWLVYRLTGSALLLGTVGFASQFPVFVLAPLGGLLADRFHRRGILVMTQALSMISAGLLAWMTLSGRINVPWLIFLAASQGVINAIDIPTRQAFVVDMVGKPDLVNAIALNSSMFNGARIIGPAIAGILVAKVGEGWCFAANSVSYIAVISGLLMMRLEHSRERKEYSALAQLKEGMRFALRTPPLRALILLVGVLSLVATPYSVLMPIIADQVLHGGAGTMGLLMGCSGAGALTSAVLLAARKGLKGMGTWAAVAASTLGVGLIGLGLSRSVHLAGLALFFVGASMMMQMACSNTLIQAMTPDAMRGRVASLYSMMFMGMAPIGALAAGSVSHALGAPRTIMCGGILAIVTAATFWSQLCKLRPMARELIIAQGMAGGEPAQEMVRQAS